MKRLTGQVLDRQGEPLCGATVMLKNKHFETVATAETDINGRYSMKAQAGNYPYSLAVRDYAEKFLEHWVGNITIREDMQINYQVDKLEVYGLTCFQIRGGAPALSLYFRPMSLEKALQGERDICPDLEENSISVFVNGEQVAVGSFNEVSEYYQKPSEQDAMKLKGYFVMTALPGAGLKASDNFVEVKIQDRYTKAIGCAGLFF